MSSLLDPAYYTRDSQPFMPTAETIKFDDFGVSQRVPSTPPHSSGAVPSQKDLFRIAAAAPAEYNTSNTTDNSNNGHTFGHASAAMAAPTSHLSSLATSAGKRTPPPTSITSPTLTDGSGVGNNADAPKGKNQNVRRNVYISNIPPTFRSEEFRHFCLQFGRVEASKLCFDNRDAPTKAYGFALYFSEESAAACIRGVNGSFWQGRCVQARLADSHATPAPLGDEGAAANTTLPPPLHPHRGGRGSSGACRLGRGTESAHSGNPRPHIHAANDTFPATGSHRGASPGSARAMSSPGLPTPPYATTPPSGPTILPSSDHAPIPMDVNAYYQFMSVMPSATTPPTQQPPPMAMMPATQARSVSLPPYASSTEGGFGAVGTPVGTPLMAGIHHHGPTNSSALSPVSMALSPQLLSSHSTDSRGSTSPNGPRANTLSAGIANFAQAANMQPYAIPPYPMSYVAQPSQQQQQQQQQAMAMANVAGAPLTYMTGTAPNGQQTFMYYPMPNGVPQAPLQAMPMTAAAVGEQAGVHAHPNSVVYFTMPPSQQQQQQPQQYVPMQATPPLNGLPANFVMLDSSNMGMQFQVMRHM